MVDRGEFGPAMRALIFGATGMVGQGVLQACLDHPDVESVTAPVRSPTGLRHEKFREIVHQDLFDLTPIEDELTEFDACFFCLGVSAAGMSESRYRLLTLDLTRSVAETVVKLNPDLTFCYVSGAGTDSSENGRVMWARIKGKTENHLLDLPFKAAYMFRPGYVQPMAGVRSKTALYRVAYTLSRPFYPLLRNLFPNSVTTSSRLSAAMIAAALDGYPRPHIEIRDINLLAEGHRQ